MTNEKTIEVLQEQIDKYGQEYDAEGIEALETAIKLVEQTSWIPCSERLPEEHGYYLITTKTEVRDLNPYYEVQIAQFDGKDFDIGYIGDGVSVIAWRELPEPYRAESEDNE